MPWYLIAWTPRDQRSAGRQWRLHTWEHVVVYPLILFSIAVFNHGISSSWFHSMKTHGGCQDCGSSIRQMWASSKRTTPRSTARPSWPLNSCRPTPHPRSCVSKSGPSATHPAQTCPLSTQHISKPFNWRHSASAKYIPCPQAWPEACSVSNYPPLAQHEAALHTLAGFMRIQGDPCAVALDKQSSHPCQAWCLRGT